MRPIILEGLAKAKTSERALGVATFVLTRALGRLLAKLLIAEMGGGLMMLDTEAVPVIVSSDGT